MHLLAAKPGAISDGSAAVELRQSPGDIVFLSAADTELAALAAAQAEVGGEAPTLRLASLLFLAHNLSVDSYVEQVVSRAKLVIVRLLGGVRYWPYGLEQVGAACARRGIPLAVLPGDDQPDPELARYCTVAPEAAHRLWQFAVQGGPANMASLLGYAATLIGHDRPWQEPAPLLRGGLYWPGSVNSTLAELRDAWRAEAPIAAVVFYRALLQGGNTGVVDALVAALQKRGLNPLPLFTTSLKEPAAADILAALLQEAPPSVVLNATAFAVAHPGAGQAATPFDACEAPVLQVVFSGGDEEAWRESAQGLSARDLAMHVALPEVDGRILSRAVSFKAEARFDAATECSIVRYRPVPDRIDFVADLAAAWARLRHTPPAERRVALVLANYPNRDGRIGNGVGLDTPAGTARVIEALRDAGYETGDAPTDGAALIELLLAGPTNRDGRAGLRAGPALPARHERPAALPPRAGTEAGATDASLTSDVYARFFGALPSAVQEAVTARWGAPDVDPFFRAGAFRLPVRRFGNLVVAIQPARGYNIDPAGSYHDPALVPPHGYLAFYAWLRTAFAAHAVVHMGKHGNLEWLPGKALALSSACYPEAALGALPHLYPFIVNDPGEGSQAKRRAAAVIVDHLTPPLTRAESYGPLQALERLVDEYYEAAGLDPRRCRILRREIVELAQRSGLDRDCGIAAADEEDAALAKLDRHLCELKELQIRDGLHVFGVAPTGALLTDLLVALTRVPRGRGEGADASLIRALARDLALTGDGFDPLSCDMAEAWTGPRPAVLEGEGSWRTAGDTVERLELLAARVVAGDATAPETWRHARAVLDGIASRLRPAVESCGARELAGLLRGLDGRFVAPGPSGAPTRGRPDVLPTGRNFYSVDTRSVPTPTAWLLGWKSATLLLERHRQEHGASPKALALSAWGTANMRTGGDDIAQALALLGVRPTWDDGSGRVSGFEVLPLSILDRPRVDVTLRISGFFRDAFPAQIDLFDSAVRAVAALDEPPADNPVAERVARETASLVAGGVSEELAARRAGHRVFGSKPGAYGAGLQALMDERGWKTAEDLARAYIAWGGYAYGGGAQGEAEHRLFERRLSAVEGILHNQDNREHDLLDSDDYYQFEGGLAVTVKALTGTRPPVYHNDHSRPENPRIRTLEEEIARIVRGRVVNPKWIRGVMRHGYKGVFEMAATVDYMVAFAATAGCVADHHFDAVFDAYIADEAVRAFMLDANPNAAREMAEKLLEAQQRGLWRPRANTAYPMLRDLAGLRAEAAE